MNNEQEVETIVVKDEKDDDSDCEIVESTPGLVDVPDYIDPNSLKALISEPNEQLPPVIEKIVNKLANDEEFEKECDKFYKDNLDIDVEMVQENVTEILVEPPKPSAPVRRITLSTPIDDKRTSSDLPGICFLCPNTDDHLKILLEHFREEHHMKDGQFVCPFCDYMSGKAEVVMKHTIKVHKLGSQKQACNECDFETFRGDLYNRHLNQHLKQDIYSCDKCNYKTINSDHYKKHVHSKHFKGPGVEYKCRFCEYSCTSIGAVRKHEGRRHMKEQTISCDKCPYKTDIAYNLKRHQEYCRGKSKSKVITYACTDCKFKANDQETLDNHTFTKHMKKEILFCKSCEFSTTKQSELTNHIQTHLKIEPDS